MMEQPLEYDDVFRHVELQARLRTPICLDESIRHRRDADHAIAVGACRIINIKMGRVGGHTEAKAVHDVCRGAPGCFRSGAEGCWRRGIGRAHNVALSTLENFSLPRRRLGQPPLFPPGHGAPPPSKSTRTRDHHTLHGPGDRLRARPGVDRPHHRPVGDLLRSGAFQAPGAAPFRRRPRGDQRGDDSPPLREASFNRARRNLCSGRLKHAPPRGRLERRPSSRPSKRAPRKTPLQPPLPEGAWKDAPPAASPRGRLERRPSPPSNVVIFVTETVYGLDTQGSPVRSLRHKLVLFISPSGG